MKSPPRPRGCPGLGGVTAFALLELFLILSIAKAVEPPAQGRGRKDHSLGAKGDHRSTSSHR